MFPQKMFARLSLLVMLLLPAIGCQHPSPVAPNVAKQAGSFSLTLNKASMPKEVRFITITLSRSNFTDIVRDFAVTDSSLTVRIDSLQVGEWRLQADAKDSTGRIIFSGKFLTMVFPGNLPGEFWNLMPNLAMKVPPLR